MIIVTCFILVSYFQIAHLCCCHVVSSSTGLLQALTELVGGHVGRCHPLVVLSDELNVK